MKSFLKHATRFFAISMILIILSCTTITPVFANNDLLKTTTDICLVFDNSGSTFLDETWCRFKYMTEIMASLIDYENGGKLYIYPLCEVTIDGQVDSANREPIEITSYQDISKLANMLTVTPGGTPFDQVENAYNYLTNESTAKKKHLFILTDGAFNLYPSDVDLNNRLLQMTEDGSIKIHYFGSGTACEIVSQESNNLSAYYMQGLVSSQDLFDFIVNSCNEIFNFNTILGTTSLQSLITVKENSSIIVIADGKTSQILALNDVNAKASPTLFYEEKLSADTLLNTHNSQAPIDKNLGCQISVFNCKTAGKYILSCENSDFVNIYINNKNDTTSDDFGIAPIEDFDKEQAASTSKIPKYIYWIVLSCVSLLVLSIVYLTLYIIRKHRKNFFEEVLPTLDTEESEDLALPPYEGEKEYIFISYAHKDADKVLPIINHMITNGYRVWYDEAINPGTEWDKNIATHVKNCYYFIAFISQNYLNSDNCKDELNYARDLNKKRFLVYLEEINLPEELQMRLSRIQNIHNHAFDCKQKFYEKLFSADGINTCKD